MRGWWTRSRARWKSSGASPPGWLLTATHAGVETVRAEPFDAVPLGLGVLWLGQVQAER